MTKDEIIQRAADKIKRLKIALIEIERLGWQEGIDYKARLIKCRAVASATLTRE